jgi:hypothetical protein
VANPLSLSQRERARVRVRPVGIKEGSRWALQCGITLRDCCRTLR